jgi:tRNA G18 (ribose-2'-O)-methylase SpoU
MCSILAARRGAVNPHRVPRWPIVATAVPITEPADERLLPYTAMTDAELRASLDAAHGVFVVEGATALARLAGSPYAAVSALCSPAKAELVGELLRDVDVEVFVAAPAVLEAVTGFSVHRGVLALARRPGALGIDALLATCRTVAVLEGLNDQTNLGAIARSARALGVDGFVLDPSCADPLYRRTVRVSMGEMLHLPFARVDGRAGGAWTDALWPALAAHRFLTLAMTPSATTLIDEVAIGPQDRVAVVLGAEGPGLSAAVLDGPVTPVRIAMAPGADSLNVGHAAAIAFWHVGRASLV